MKKACLLLPLFLALAFSACTEQWAQWEGEQLLKRSQEQEKQEGQEKQEVRFALLLMVDGKEAEAVLTWTEQEQHLAFTAPDMLSGFAVLRRESGLTLSMEGLSVKLPQGALLDSAAARQIFAAFDTWLTAEPTERELVLEDDLLELEYDSGSLWIEEQSAWPVAISGENIEGQIRHLELEQEQK